MATKQHARHGKRPGKGSRKGQASDKAAILGAKGLDAGYELVKGWKKLWPKPRPSFFAAIARGQSRDGSGDMPDPAYKPSVTLRLEVVIEVFPAIRGIGPLERTLEDDADSLETLMVRTIRDNDGEHQLRNQIRDTDFVGVKEFALLDCQIRNAPCEVKRAG